MDKRKKAASIEHNPSSLAPIVSAKGSGAIADRILDKGKEESVPVISDPKLLEELMGVGLEERIPPELYEAVAQVLIYVESLEREAARQL
jgi:flagellar biosynthesis protein